MQSHQKTVGRLIAVAVLALSFTVRAADVYFPNADESGDLARLEAWGDTPFPTSVDQIKLTTRIGTYHVSTNVNLGGILSWGNGYPSTNVIDQTDYPNTTVTLPNGFRIFRNQDTLDITGGKWDFTKTGVLASCGGGTVGTDCSVTLKDVTASNVKEFLCGAWGTYNTRLIVTNSHITANGVYLFEKQVYDAFYGQYDSTVELVGTAGRMYFYLGNADGYGSTALFSGAKTVFTNCNPKSSAYTFLFNDNRATNNQFIVERGAKVYLDNSVYFVTGANCCSNRISIVGEGSLVRTGKLTAESTNPDGVDNVIEVRDGGTLSASQIDIQAGVDIVVSNGTLTTPTVYVGRKAESKNIRVFVQGSEANLDLTNYWFFNAGHNHLWEFDGATCLRPDAKPFWAAGQGLSSNVVRLVNGANVSLKQLGIPREDACSSPAYGNELFVGNDSTMEIVNYLYAESVDSRIVVSNGTLLVNRAKNTSNHFILGNQSGATNCTLVLQGTTPKVKSGYTLVFWKHSVLQLDLPEKDLRLTEPLVEVQKVQANLEPMYLKVTGWEKYQEGLSESANIPVISATSAFDANTLAAIDEANANLVAEGANRVYFYTSSDKTKLYLHVHHPPRGMTIILR